METIPLTDIDGKSARAEARLLLSTARPSFDEGEIERVRSLIAQISDWNLVAETADRKFSTPYLHKALLRADSKLVPPAFLTRLRNSSRNTNYRALKVAAAQVSFHQKCIAPIRARHAYMKGIALSVQFSGKFSDRFCRDIDVLVDPRDFERVIYAAIDHKYRVLLTKKPVKFAASRSDFKFLARFPADVELVSPEGIQIEVHRRLDKKDYIFDVHDALTTSSTIKLSNEPIQTLRPALHFTYACYHHSRHFWSHLHWIADLNLMLRSDKINLEHLRATSDALGLTPTTEAAIELNRLLSRPSLWQNTGQQPTLAYEFLNACLSNLYGGLEVERKLRANSFRHDLMSQAQVSHDKLNRTKATALKTKFHPVLSQYLKYPLPASFFWLYRLQQATIVVRDQIKRIRFAIPSKHSLEQRSQSVDQSGNDDESI